MRRAALAGLVGLLLAGPARAWDRHEEITAAALRGVAGLDRGVVPETLESYLAATGRPGLDAFLRARRMNPTTRFAYRVGEVDGSTIALRAVIAGYADEPDWSMDQQLFDFYPELWKDDYLYMVGSKNGYQTRVFRHAYWPAGFLKPPPPGSHVPVADATPLGEAPERAQLFFDLSREAFTQGHPYWGARFLAWSLHYVEDLTQPFHAVQVPSMDYLRVKPDGSFDFEATARTLAYYHLAVDGFPTHAGDGSAGQAIHDEVDGALSGADAARVSSARELALVAAARSAHAALKLSDAAEDLFPEPDAAALADPLNAVYNPGFWRQVRGAGGKTSEAFMRRLEPLLSWQGAAIRGLVLADLPPPPSLARRDLAARVLRGIQRLLSDPL